MGFISEFTFVVILVCTGVHGDIPNELKKDFFDIYKGIAVETKNIINTPVTRDKVTFHAYKKDGLPVDTVLNFTNLDVLESTKDKVIFITHGWGSQADNDWVLNLKDAFLATYPKSAVITVDWRDPAGQLYYIASISTFDVGNFIAEIIEELINKHKIDISKVLLVGHSLGAQASGFTGKKIKETGKVLHRIVGLDPAGPLFDIRPRSKRLNPNDAEVVEVVHSNTGRFGFKDSCGTIDFFPNGGDQQPGCARIDLLDISSVADPVVCDHQRSYLYFTEAVAAPTEFTARKCSRWNILRKDCNDSDTVNLGDLTTRKTGNYYFETNKERPYSKRVKKSKGLLDSIGDLVKF